MLDSWVAEQAATLQGRVVNVGAGEDRQRYGRRVVRVDAFAPQPDVRADLGASLPFADRAFDGGVCTEVLEHVSDARLLLRELARVLKPGATLLVSVPFIFHYHADPRDFLRFTPPGLAAELERAGFQVEFIGGIGGRLAALALWTESLAFPLKMAVRLLSLATGPVLARRRPRAGQWSPWAAHVVAVAHRREHANR
jgi:SAM-dependent methyltransferase